MVIGGGAGGRRSSGLTPKGGAPGYISEGLFLASGVSNSVSVTVGSGSVGGVTPTAGGNSSFGSYGAAGGIVFLTANNLGSSADAEELLVSARPGQGGASRNHAEHRRGVPGLGSSDFTTTGNDGADSTTGTGGGGGGNNGNGTTGGDGGIPGGGGGSTAGSTVTTPGDGGRGEVRVFAW